MSVGLNSFGQPAALSKFSADATFWVLCCIVVATTVVVIVVVVVRTVVGCFVVTVVLLAVVKIVVFPSCNVACFCSLDVVVDKTVVVKVLSSRSVTSTVVGFVRVWGSVRGSVRRSVWGSGGAHCGRFRTAQYIEGYAR